MTNNKAEKGCINDLENGFDCGIPKSRRVVDVLLGEIEVGICRVVLPFLRLLCIPNTEAESPGDANGGVGNKVRRSLGVACQLCGLNLGFHDGKRARLSPNNTAVLLFHALASAKDDCLSALELAHRDLVEFDLGRRTRVEKNKKTHGE